MAELRALLETEPWTWTHRETALTACLWQSHVRTAKAIQESGSNEVRYEHVQPDVLRGRQCITNEKNFSRPRG